MLTENGVQVDLDAVNKVLREADVLTVGFTFMADRLLIDTRSNEVAGALVSLVAPVTSVQERYLWLGQNRPSFGAPAAFSFFVWPHTIRTLVERDVLGPLKDRLGSSGQQGAVATLNSALAAIAGQERQSMCDAIRGAEPWASVWARTSSAG